MKMDRRAFNRGSVSLLVAGGAVLTARGASAGNVYDARVVKFEIERNMTPGRTYRARIVLRNTGTLRWAGADFYVQCENTSSPGGAKAQEDDFRFETKINDDVLPNQEITLFGELTAPRRAGPWTLRCRMMRKQQAFGDPATADVTVIAALNAVIDSIRMDELLQPGKEAEIVVRVRNSGQADWTADRVDLHVAVNRAVRGNLGALRNDWECHIPLKAAVPAGDTTEFRFKIRPRIAGQVILAFAMWDRVEKDEFGEEERRDILIA